jgi:nitrate/nitrite-specific signal transduction histidine kinase
VKRISSPEKTALGLRLLSQPLNMQKSARFRVDPKLVHVLGESYTSSEKALKELVDNAWDAEATEVHITVPNILTDSPITVQDNGSGMKTAQTFSYYSLS